MRKDKVKVITDMKVLFSARRIVRRLRAQGVIYNSEHDTLVDALEQQQVPEGWRLVPIEPTRRMVEAAAGVLNSEQSTIFFTNQYKAMLAASPNPEKVE